MRSDPRVDDTAGRAGQVLRLLSLPLAVSLVACGNSSAPVPGGLAGTYATRVTLVQTACGPVTVQDNPTVVTYDPSSGAVTLTHAGNTYSGTVNMDSTFTTVPKTVDVGDGYIYTIALAGRFRPSAFDADVTVDRASGSTTCRYVVHWVGTK